MMLTHCGNNVRNRYSGCVFSVKDIVPVPLKTSRNLTEFTNSTLIMDGTANFQRSVFTDVDHSRFILSGGAVFALPASLTNCDSSGGMGTNEQRAVFSADGVGTLLDLSSLETMNSDFSGLGGLLQLVSASDGGTVDLSGMQTINGGGSGVNGGGPLEFRAESGSSIDLSSLTTVTGTGAGVFFNASPKISAFKGRTRNFVIPNVICRAGSSFAAASRGLILGFAYFETYSLCFNVSSGLFFVCADSPPVLFTPADLLGPLPGRHRSQPFPGAEKSPIHSFQLKSR